MDLTENVHADVPGCVKKKIYIYTHSQRIKHVMNKFETFLGRVKVISFHNFVKQIFHFKNVNEPFCFYFCVR